MQNNELKLPTFLNKSYLNLDPYFITGLIEAEGSFSIVKKWDKRAKYGINVGLRFNKGRGRIWNPNVKSQIINVWNS